MSSKVAPTLHITPLDTDALDEKTGTSSIPDSALATIRIDESVQSDSSGMTAAATAIAAISGLGLGLGLGSDSDDDADKPAVTPTSSAAAITAATSGKDCSNSDAQNDVAAGAKKSKLAGRLSVSGLTAAWTAKAKREGAGDNHPEDGRGGSHLHLKTVASLPGMSGREPREHIASYAEEHAADVSAEINSLSKVRLWTAAIPSVSLSGIRFSPAPPVLSVKMLTNLCYLGGTRVQPPPGVDYKLF